MRAKKLQAGQHLLKPTAFSISPQSGSASSTRGLIARNSFSLPWLVCAIRNSPKYPGSRVSPPQHTVALQIMNKNSRCCFGFHFGDSTPVVPLLFRVQYNTFPFFFLNSPLTRADCLPNVISRELGDSGSLRYCVVPHLWTTIKLSIPELTARVALLFCGDQRVPLIVPFTVPLGLARSPLYGLQR